MSYELEKFTVAGDVKLQLKPTSPKNVAEFQDILFDSVNQALGDNASVEDMSVEDLEKEFDRESFLRQQGEKYIDMLRGFTTVVSSGKTFDDIDPDALDMNKVEHYVKVFMPGQSPT